MPAPQPPPDQPADRDSTEPGYRHIAEDMTREWVLRTTAVAGGVLLAAGVLTALTGGVLGGVVAASAGAGALALPIMLMPRRPRRRVQWIVLLGCWLLIASGVTVLVIGD